MATNDPNSAGWDHPECAGGRRNNRSHLGRAYARTSRPSWMRHFVRRPICLADSNAPKFPQFFLSTSFWTVLPISIKRRQTFSRNEITCVQTMRCFRPDTLAVARLKPPGNRVSGQQKAQACSRGARRRDGGQLRWRKIDLVGTAEPWPLCRRRQSSLAATGDRSLTLRPKLLHELNAPNR
jgi:hypothetical protein